jgi:hypothetical protein
MKHQEAEGQADRRSRAGVDCSRKVMTHLLLIYQSVNFRFAHFPPCRPQFSSQHVGRGNYQRQGVELKEELSKRGLETTGLKKDVSIVCSP